MFTDIPEGKKDPIFALNEKFRNDTRAQKLDLGVGVFKNESGCTPIMDVVAKAEAMVLYEQETKVYKGLMGNESFNEQIANLLIHYPDTVERTAVVQTTGGSGALRLVSDYIYSVNPKATVWVSNPSYANHAPILQDAGLRVSFYDYLDPVTRLVDNERIMNGIAKAERGDVVLLHGCCHNPTGADLTYEQWSELAKNMSSKGLVPFIDIAYQGLGTSLVEDAQGLNVVLAHCPEAFITTSCSKNFGLYAERIGAALIVCDNPHSVGNVRRRMANLALNSYAMPPNHGAEIVAKILSQPALFECWEQELEQMRAQIIGNRMSLYSALEQCGYPGDIGFVLNHKGMFSSFGWSDDMLHNLRVNHGIYVVQGGRINFAALPQDRAKEVAKLICYYVDAPRHAKKLTQNS